VLLEKLLQVCSEELQKAARAFVLMHEALRELDDRTLEQAILFFKIW